MSEPGDSGLDESPIEGGFRAHDDDSWTSRAGAIKVNPVATEVH
ncbi:MAG TPA: hypothetical protein VL156_09310 [Terriglobales bacterium]|jgi:hypothetical protein|nr:hypothetical protein [Terriglobales bacterium]